MSDTIAEPTDPAAPARPADFGAAPAAAFLRIVPIVLVVAAVILRSIRPLQEAVASHGRDHESVFFAILTPALVVVLLLVLLLLRVSPFVRERRLRADNPGALVVTGQWARETSELIPGRAGTNQFATYTLVIDHGGLAFYDGRFRGELVHRITASDVEWINSQMVRGWQRPQRGLLLTTRSSGQIPLLIIAFSNPLGMFVSRGGLTVLAQETRRRLGLPQGAAR